MPRKLTRKVIAQLEDLGNTFDGSTWWHDVEGDALVRLKREESTHQYDLAEFRALRYRREDGLVFVFDNTTLDGETLWALGVAADNGLVPKINQVSDDELLSYLERIR